MIFLDKAGHLVTDGQLQELHAFADKLKRSFGRKGIAFHPHRRHPHYDLKNDRVRSWAHAFGAWPVSSRDIIKILAKREASAS